MLLPPCLAELEDDLSSEDYQHKDASAAAAADEEEESADESSAEEDQDDQEERQQQKRPLSSRIKVVQARRPKPPLAPKQQPKDPAAAPAKRSFLTLAVSARK